MALSTHKNSQPVEEAVMDRRNRGGESHRRSLAKALSWRVTALIVTMAVAWVVTGDAKFAAAIGAADAAVKIGLYYLHERAWNRSNFGRKAR